MRMYLSSFREGEQPWRLTDLVREPGGAEVAVIGNALDGEAEEVRRAGVRREVQALAALGLTPTEVDLRAFFGESAVAMAGALGRFPVVWARGGNVFMLRYAMARSGADAILTALLRGDRVVYGGYSAGICVLAPSLRGLELCDDHDAVTRVHGEEPVWDGLGVLDHALLPHVDTPGHPESERIEQVLAAYRAEGVPHVALRDGQALVIDGTHRDVY